MAGRRDVFELALESGHSAAWEGRWDQAVVAYQTAVMEFPDDGAALTALGYAFLQVNKLKEALTVYQRAAGKVPGDPLPPEKCGEIFERIGRRTEAAQTYLYVADLYARRGDEPKCLGNLARAVRLTPDNLGARSRLAIALEKGGNAQPAAHEFIEIARLFQAAQANDKAAAALTRALQLVPELPEARDGFMALKNGIAIPQRNRALELVAEPAPTAAPGQNRLTDLTPKPAPLKRYANPLAAAHDVAMEALAELLFDEDADTSKLTGSMSGLSRGAFRDAQGQRAQAITYLGQALNEHSLGDLEAALTLYDQTIQAGLDHALIHFMRGAINLELRRPEVAWTAFGPATSRDDIAAGAWFGMAEAGRHLRQTRDAFKAYFESLKALDGSLVADARRDQLIEAYDTLAETFSRMSDDDLGKLIAGLQRQLSGEGWYERAQSTRHQLDENELPGSISTLADMLAVPGTDQVMDSLRKIESYMRQGQHATAMEEAFFALHASPTYLPVHIRMAEILVAEGKLDAAAQKFRVIASTYQARGEHGRAARLLQRVLQLNPLDTQSRTDLISLLLSQGHLDDALAQSVELGKTYYELADLDGARDQYARALELAQKRGDRGWSIRILHEIGDVDVQRLAWREAVRVYEQIKALDPEDETSRIARIDLYLRLDNLKAALPELDAQVKHLLAQRQIANATLLLEELANSYPSQPTVIARLARLYQDQGRKGDAIQRYDQLTEQHLQAGHPEQAREAVQAILALQPDDPTPYVRLLGQIV
jgi:tetratricopeptide (TPR) repeat protein